MQMDLPSNHPVVRLGGKEYLIDTGSPLTFSYDGDPSLEIDGREYAFSRSDLISLLCTEDAPTRLIGRRVAGIIGMDILSKTGLTLDFENRTAEFSFRPESAPGVPCAVLSFDLFMNHYIVTNDVILGRRLQNAIIDSGAPVPYVSERIAADLEKTGELYEDYSPDYGELRGEYRRGELILSAGGTEYAHSVKVGVMPAVLNMLGCFDAILGIQALTDKRVAFDFDNKKLYVTL